MREEKWPGQALLGCPGRDCVIAIARTEAMDEDYDPICSRVGCRVAADIAGGVQFLRDAGRGSYEEEYSQHPARASEDHFVPVDSVSPK